MASGRGYKIAGCRRGGLHFRIGAQRGRRLGTGRVRNREAQDELLRRNCGNVLNLSIYYPIYIVNGK